MPLKTTGPVSWLDDLASSTGLQRIEPVLRDLEQKQQAAAEMPPVETPKPYTSFSDSVGAVKSWIDRMRAPEAAAPSSDSGQPQAMPTGSGEAGQTGAPPQTAPQSASSSATGQHGEIDNSSRQAFVRTAWPYMLEAAGGDANLAELMLAKAISENGDIGKGGDIIGWNVSGIKGAGDAGSFEADTWEQVNGQRVNIRDKFAAYSSPQVGFGAFMKFLQDNPRYHAALAEYQRTGNAEKLFDDVNAAGYATDPIWSQKLRSIRDSQVAPVVRRQQQPSAAPQASMHPKVQSAFEAANGRPPTASELEELRSMGLA